MSRHALLGTGGCYLIAAIVAVVLAPSRLMAVRPYRPSDAELARYPIIVIARWNKGLVQQANGERQTELLVERVIKGPIEPGTHRIILGFGICWPRKDGGPIECILPSSETSGDVEEVTESNIWLLQRARSADPDDAERYLKLDTYRGVQPLSRQAEFEKLGVNQRVVPCVLATLFVLITAATTMWWRRQAPHRHSKAPGPNNG